MELVFLGAIGGSAYLFWLLFCGNSLAGCLGDTPLSKTFSYFLLAVIRPFVLTPTFVVEMMAGATFGPFLGATIAVLGNLIAAMALYVPGKHLGRSFLHPWLSRNLPATWKLICTQDHKIIFAMRWIPIFPFDLVSLIAGAAGFRPGRFLVMTAIGVLPQAVIFTSIGHFFGQVGDNRGFYILLVVSLVATVFLIPLVINEYMNRNNGGGLWTTIRKTVNELKLELIKNNTIQDTGTISGKRPPVLILYGFFSSQTSVLTMKANLEASGFDVISINLGGMFGVFNTSGILKSATILDEAVATLKEAHGVKKVYIVAHSKGGLIGLWWLLRGGGHKHCNKIITMGSPFRGTWLSYLALVTPLGLIWRGVWEMRPGSRLLKAFASDRIPDELKVVCVTSERDRVCRGLRGVPPNHEKRGIVHVTMNDKAHFDYLVDSVVADRVSKLLNDSEEDPLDHEKI